MSYRAPPGRAMKSDLPATKQAAGVPSAWSQPFQSTRERPRRWRDAGPLGRQSVTAARKAGDEDSIRGSISDSVRNHRQRQRRRQSSGAATVAAIRDSVRNQRQNVRDRTFPLTRIAASTLLVVLDETGICASALKPSPRGLDQPEGPLPPVVPGHGAIEVFG